MELGKAIKLFLKETKHTDISLDNDMIVKNVAFNQALNVIAMFIENLENGRVNNDYLINLDKKHNKR